ncbi:hypothetical protein GEV33_011594 [Tenebrio molitor]|uniref:Uncharacterized protein n=1 Tax=Tenebrio molitor TaxID=7067 RepID=A0A8J6HBG0_TENMO|nr:hypothetical protein GEV33_011594 [Tenebrio molitor]
MGQVVIDLDSSRLFLTRTCLKTLTHAVLSVAEFKTTKLTVPLGWEDSEVSGASNYLVTNLFVRRYSLRQLDLSLLSQLWSLNESIQDFRQILQDQEDRVLSPPSPSPTPSSGDEGDADEFYMSTSSMNFRTPPPPLPVRRPSSSSNASSLG